MSYKNLIFSSIFISELQKRDYKPTPLEVKMYFSLLFLFLTCFRILHHHMKRNGLYLEITSHENENVQGWRSLS